MLNEQQIKEFIESIEYNPLPRDQYVRKTSIKTQLTGHHTVSGSDPDKYWLMDKKRISTNFHLRRDGQLVQLFGSKFYGYHLGLGKDDFEDINLPYKFLDPLTISVEIINWGPLVLRRKEWYNIYGGVVQDPDVQYYKGGFNGFTDFERYTPEQIAKFVELAKYCNAVYDMPLTYQMGENFEKMRAALKGEPGVFTHTNYRGDEKSDLHPQPELIKAFKDLEEEWKTHESI